MEHISSLSNYFLIATPALDAPAFAKTVILVCSYEPSGAIGLVLNRPLKYSVQELLTQIDIPTPGHKKRLKQIPVFSGGPVEPQRGFVLHAPTEEKWEASAYVNPGLMLTSSKDILQAIAQGKGPRDFHLALGYSGWDGAQLDHELRENNWIIAPYDPAIVFKTPVDERWSAAGQLVGITMTSLSGIFGHA